MRITWNRNPPAAFLWQEMASSNFPAATKRSAFLHCWWAWKRWYNILHYFIMCLLTLKTDNSTDNQCQLISCVLHCPAVSSVPSKTLISWFGCLTGVRAELCRTAPSSSRIGHPCSKGVPLKNSNESSSKPFNHSRRVSKLMWLLLTSLHHSRSSFILIWFNFSVVLQAVQRNYWELVFYSNSPSSAYMKYELTFLM